MTLFLPTAIHKRITDIKIETLENLKIEALLLDVDNTLSTHHGTVLVEGLTDWLRLMQDNGYKIIIVSNSKRFRIEPFAKRINLPFISLACKPLPFGYRKAVKELGVKKQNCAIIGDQIFTDVLGAKFYKIKSLLVRPIKEETGLSFRIRRYFEKKILKENY